MDTRTREFCYPVIASGYTYSYTPPDQLRVFTKTADILVVATGIPGLITADMVKPGVAVIDVGINRVYDEQLGKYKLVGDVDFEGELLDFINGDF